MALALGANVAVFSVVDAVMLRPLPFSDPDRLYSITQEMGGESGRGMAPVDVLLLEERTTSFASIGWYREAQSLTLTGDGEPEVLRGRAVSADFFEVIGRDASLGRTFTRDEDRPGSDGVVVLAHDYWVRRFAGDPSVIGGVLIIGNQPRTVVGVLDADFRFDLDGGQDVFIPRVFDPESGNFTGWFSEHVVARLSPDVSPTAALSELDSWASGLEEEAPTRRTDVSVGIESLGGTFVGDSRAVLHALLLAGGLVLLVVAANLVHLAMARLTSRSGEIAVRSALGATRERIIIEQMVESGLLAVVGLTAGVILAAMTLPGIVAASPSDVPGLAGARLDQRVLGFGLMIGAFVSLIVGTLPTLLALDRGEALMGGRLGGTRTASLPRAGLVVAEIAVVTALILVSLLLAESLRNARAVDPGFDLSEGLAVQITVPSDRYPTAPEVQALFRAIIAELESLPGVTAVGGASTLPLSSDGITIPAPVAEGFELTGPAIATRPRTGWDAVTPGYFDALGIGVLRGRRFSELDAQDSVTVVAVNETFARAVFGDEDPIGRRVGFGTPPTAWFEVVALVQDVHHDGLRERPRLGMYQYAGDVTFAWPTLEIVVRSDGPLPSERAIRTAVLRVDRDQPVTLLRPLSDVWRESMALDRYQTALISMVTLLALVLGVFGTYGVVNYSTSQRRKEIGVRMALGARSGEVVGEVLGRTALQVGVGLALGIGAGALSARALTTHLFEVGPLDPRALGMVAVLVMTLGVGAAVFPALRAARTQPVEALRDG